MESALGGDHLGPGVGVQDPLTQHTQHRGAHREQGPDSLVILIITPAIMTTVS